MIYKGLNKIIGRVDSMKKKVGIITWHYYGNYGSALQSYALQTMICKQGYSCELINYRKLKFKSSRLKTVLKYILSYISIILPKEKKTRYSYSFIRFQYDFLKQSKRTYNAETLKKFNSKYEVFVCGSDQIWAPNVFDPVYFLSFVNDKKPKIAYAPSIGLNSIPDSLHDDYNKLLSRFNCLSVREKRGAELIKNICNLEAEVLLDPTFLLDKIEWQRIAINPVINEEYIFCYFLGKNKAHREAVKKIASQLKCKIISVLHFDMDREFADFLDEFAGPREFLGYVKNAKLIYTDSFHGMAFSINFNKNFYVFERFSSTDNIGQNSRIHNILNKLGLNDHLIKYDNPICRINEIEYDDVNILLEDERKKSINYLKNSISKYCKAKK
jgi:hypothetical protein